ncbi:MAG TPA: hypothetical protein VLT90_06335 [Terriglobales bacterium]|nr:hypothetical protein [Terriglobales bacterium]
MKRMVWMAIGALLWMGANLVLAQSLGDVARSTRKGKAQQSAPNHKYDNDNLPKDDHLSVVGPSAPAANPADSTNAQAPSPQQAQADPKTTAEERQKANDEWKDKIDAQQKKVDDLARELDLTQREYKLHSAVVASDAGYRLRNAAMWDKEEADFRKQIEEKQKALDAAKQELSDVKEQARKAGAPAAKE